MAMNRIFLSAGILIGIGIAMMAVAEGMVAVANDRYWDVWLTGTEEQFVDVGRDIDRIWSIWGAGFIVAVSGIAVMAFGLATMQPKPAPVQPSAVAPVYAYPYAPPPITYPTPPEGPRVPPQQ